MSCIVRAAVARDRHGYISPPARRIAEQRRLNGSFAVSCWFISV